MNTKLPLLFFAIPLTSLGLGIHLYTVSLVFASASQLEQPGNLIAQPDLTQSDFPRLDPSQAHPLPFSQTRGIPGRRASAGSR
jgi:hypothetical protein